MTIMPNKCYMQGEGRGFTRDTGNEPLTTLCGLLVADPSLVMLMLEVLEARIVCTEVICTHGTAQHSTARIISMPSLSPSHTK